MRRGEGGERRDRGRGEEGEERWKVEGGAACQATLLYCACSRSARSQKRHPICKLKQINKKLKEFKNGIELSPPGCHIGQLLNVTGKKNGKMRAVS